MYKRGRPGEKDKTLKVKLPQFPQGPPATDSDEVPYRTNDIRGCSLSQILKILLIYEIIFSFSSILVVFLLIRAAEKYWPVSCLITAWSWFRSSLSAFLSELLERKIQLQLQPHCLILPQYSSLQSWHHSVVSVFHPQKSLIDLLIPVAKSHNHPLQGPHQVQRDTLSNPQPLQSPAMERKPDT